jgi:TIR domain
MPSPGLVYWLEKSVASPQYSEDGLLHDVFICHASEDKETFVRPLAEALRAHHLDVWYDDFVLTVGDSLREAIDRGLADSRFGIVVLSPHFFQKRWPKRELNGLVAREVSEDRQLILPIWHHIGRDEIVRYSPPLADLIGVSSDLGMDAVVTALLKKLRPEESPLIVARNFLISKGVSPPIVTDEWWLDLVEFKEAELRFPLNVGRRWIFPLPFPEAARGKERGLNIAWTALQWDWAFDGEERNLCQLTHPEELHTFLHEWPGLYECARANPGVLAMYAPQLTIPGFDDGFDDVFDALMDPKRHDAYQMPGYGGPPATTDGKEPLCGELIAWRHPTFGNYTDAELAASFVSAHDCHYSRKLFSGFECLTWLLSNDSKWMPQRLRETLLRECEREPSGGLTTSFPWRKMRSVIPCCTVHAPSSNSPVRFGQPSSSYLTRRSTPSALKKTRQ